MRKALNKAAKDHAKHYEESYRNIVSATFISGANWMRSNFSLHGTDGCKTCETGKSTLAVAIIKVFKKKQHKTCKSVTPGKKGE